MRLQCSIVKERSKPQAANMIKLNYCELRSPQVGAQRSKAAIAFDFKVGAGTTAKSCCLANRNLVVHLEGTTLVHPQYLMSGRGPFHMKTVALSVLSYLRSRTDRQPAGKNGTNQL